MKNPQINSVQFNSRHIETIESRTGGVSYQLVKNQMPVGPQPPNPGLDPDKEQKETLRLDEVMNGLREMAAADPELLQVLENLLAELRMSVIISR